MSKKIIGLIVVVIAIVGVLGILQNNQPSKVIEGSIKIGALAPLTGQISVLGERMRNGMEMARLDLIKEGVVEDLEIIYEDACDTKTSLNATRKLIDVDKVSIIGSSFCLPGIDAVSSFTESKKVILFNTAANPESVLNKKYLFSTNVAIRDDANKIAEFAYDSGARSAAIIHLDTSFGESYRDNFIDRFNELDGEVLITEAKLLDATDFRTELTKIKAVNPDVLVIIHFGSSLGNALKQTRELGINSMIIGDYESEDPTVLKFAGSAAEGFIISSSQPAVRTETIEKFENEYLEKYGELPDVLARNAYDSIQLQVRAYVACGGDTDCIAKRLEKTKNYKGVSGIITINSKDHSTKKTTIFKIVENGEFVPYKY